LFCLSFSSSTRFDTHHVIFKQTHHV
jgi:hypothetical protein